MLARSRGLAVQANGMAQVQGQQQFNSRIKMPQPVYTTNMSLAPPVAQQFVVQHQPRHPQERKKSHAGESKEMRALWHGDHIQRPTVVSADMSESEALNRLSLVEDNSAHLALQQSLHTINQSSQREHTPPDREREELMRERDDLRRERELFLKEQEAARKEQQAIRKEQQEIRKEQEQIRREQEDLHKERQTMSREKESLAKLQESVRKTETLLDEKHSVATHSIPIPTPTPESILLDFNNSRISKQVSNVHSSPDKSEAEVVRRYDNKIRELQELADRRLMEVSETIEVAEKREKQIIDEFENYIDKLRTEKHQLLSINKQYEEEIQKLQEESEKAKKVNSEHYTNEIDRITNILVAKENQIHELNQNIAQLEAQLGSGKNQQFDLNLKLINYEKRVQLLQSEIVKYTDVIRSKNQELYELKNLSFQTDKTSSISKHIESASREVDRLNELILQKSSEASQYRTQIGDLQIKLAKAVHRQDALSEQKLIEINRLRQQLESKEFEYNRLRQTIMIKESHISEIQSAKDQIRHKVGQLQDQIDRVKDQNKYLINDLQHRNTEVEKRNKQLENQIKDARKMINQISKIRPRIQDKNPEQVKALHEKITQLTSQLEKQRTQNIRSRKKYEDTILSNQRLKVDFENRINDLNNVVSKKQIEIQSLSRNICSVENQNTQLNHKMIKLVQEKNELQSELMAADAIKSQKQAQIDRKSLQLQQLTNEYNLIMNKYRYDYERTYHDTLKQYQNKISTMQKQYTSSRKNRSPGNNARTQGIEEDLKEVKKENKKLRQLLDQYREIQTSNGDSLQSMIEIQVRCSELQQRIDGSAGHLSGVFGKLVGDINNQMKKLRQQNSVLRKQEPRHRSGTEFERMRIQMSTLEEKNQALSNQITRLSQQLMEPKTNHKKEKIALLEEKADYYRKKTTQLESRINQLLTLNNELTTQIAHFKSQESTELVKQRLNQSQSQTLAIKSQWKKANEQVHTLKTHYESQILQLQLNINSLQHRLSDQTKQLTFYQQQNIQNEQRITQLSLQLSASVNSPQPYEMTQNLSKRNEELKKKVEDLTTQNLSLKNSKIIKERKIAEFETQFKSKSKTQTVADERRQYIVQLEATVGKLNEGLLLANNTLTIFNTERQKMLADMNRYQLQIKRLSNQNEQMNSLLASKSSKNIPVVLEQQLARLSQDLLIIRSDRDSIALKQQQLTQQNAQLTLNLQFLQQQSNQNKLNTINIYRTFTLFAQRLKTVTSKLQQLFVSVNPAHSLPEPLSDLSSIINEILQWSIQQQRLSQQNTQQNS